MGDRIQELHHLYMLTYKLLLLGQGQLTHNEHR